MQRAANREHMRRRRASGTPGGALGPLVDAELRIYKAADVLAVLDEQIAAVLDDDQMATAERARVVATLAGVVLRAIEASDLAARVDAVEQVLSARQAST
jgi:hypothetical protein